MFAELFSGTFFLLAAQHAQAHALDYTVVKTGLVAEGNVLQFTTELPQAFDAPATEEDRAQMEAYYAERLIVRYQDAACAVALDRLVSRTEEEGARVEGSFTCSSPIARIDDVAVESTLFTNLFKHMDHFVTVSDGTAMREFIFSTIGAAAGEGSDASSSLAVLPKGGGRREETVFAVVMRFVRLGIEHILLGFDHILFLLAVILVVRGLKRVLALVTAFTLAHSVTLILAGLGLITLTARIVEPFIALSIVYMAVKDFWVLKRQQDEQTLRGRWAVTAGFGLVHGLGFAGALAEVGIPSRFFVPALIAFNGGVEIGQMIILAAVLPLLKLMELRQWRWRRSALMAVAGLLMVISLVWFVQRIPY